MSKRPSIASQISRVLPRKIKCNAPCDDGACMMPISHKNYLEKIAIPVMLHGLQMLARERPSDPVEELSEYLLQKRDICDSPRTGNIEK